MQQSKQIHGKPSGNKSHSGVASSPMENLLDDIIPGVELLRVDRVARLLDITNKRVYRLVQDQHLQAVRLGPRQMRIVRSSLEGYLQKVIARNNH